MNITINGKLIIRDFITPLTFFNQAKMDLDLYLFGIHFTFPLQDFGKIIKKRCLVIVLKKETIMHFIDYIKIIGTHYKFFFYFVHF